MAGEVRAGAGRGGVAVVVVVLLVVMALLVVAQPVVAAPSARARVADGHRWPVRPAVVARPFEPPVADWLPGHRGVDLRAPHGAPVAASAAGTVAFAGSVAGSAWVSVEHPGGERTAYGPLADLDVARGDAVAQGARLGTLAASEDHDGLHWSARRDGEYVDPLGLLARRLVPSLVGPGGWSPAVEAQRPRHEPWDGRDTTLGLLPGTRPATGPGWSTPPNPNHVIGVPGLLTDAGARPMDLGHLGYPPRATTYLGHGGRVPGVRAAPHDPARDQRPHEPGDTLHGVHASALLLRDQLRAQWAREPGVAVDLVGHSMGGVVVLHYLLAVHDPADPTLPPIAHVVTLAAPLQGADLASAGQDALGQWSVTRAAVELFAAAADLRLRDGTLDDLAVGSPLLRELAEAWSRASDAPYRSPLAAGTQVLTVGGATDLVVPEHRSDLPGAEHAVVPGGHDGMRRQEAVHHVVRAFLAGEVVPAGEGSWGAWASGAWSVLQRLGGVLEHP